MNPTPEQIAESEAEEREAEALVDAQWKAADAWIAAEWPHASDETRAAVRSVWTELASRQGATGLLAPAAPMQGLAAYLRAQASALERSYLSPKDAPHDNIATLRQWALEVDGAAGVATDGKDQP